MKEKQDMELFFSTFALLTVPAEIAKLVSKRKSKSRYSRYSFSINLGFSLTLLGLCACHAQAPDDSVIVQARDAWRSGDTAKLAQAKRQATNHPLAMWVDYWDLNAHLRQATPEEVEAFFSRWPNTYVEDRLRNDWLLELGRRRDWAQFATTWPAYRMRDDPEVACYAVLTRYLKNENVKDSAIKTWFDQREADNGCAFLATTLAQRHDLSEADIWRKLRQSVENNRLRTAKQIATLLGPETSKAVVEAIDNPSRALEKKVAIWNTAKGSDIKGLALIRLATLDPSATAERMTAKWQHILPREAASWVWASLGRQAAQKQFTTAPLYFDHAWSANSAARSTSATEEESDATNEPQPTSGLPQWSDETFAWQARAAMRAATAEGVATTKARHYWFQLQQAIQAMSEAQQRDPTWIYWKARALMATPPDSAVSPTALSKPPQQAQQAQQWLRSIANPYSFYGLLALEDLGLAPQWPNPEKSALTVTDMNQARSNPGLTRGLYLTKLGLRSEGAREWNYTLSFGKNNGPLNDHELIAAAQLACDQEVWDRCINTSDKTREEINLKQRFPTPYRDSMVNTATKTNLDIAYAYGLTRQESRFVSFAKSSVGASGLMQVMPATARWTAKRLNLEHDAEHLTDPQTNLAIGMGYLKLLLTDFGDSQALAAAAYNAGPGRPRKWRQGDTIDAAAWVENIPFNETRDYVKRVLSNAVAYATIFNTQPTTLKARLGSKIGPNTPATNGSPNPDLP